MGKHISKVTNEAFLALLKHGTMYTKELNLNNVQEQMLQLIHLQAEVGVREDEKSSALPLLSNIVVAYTERIKRKINRSKKHVC